MRVVAMAMLAGSITLAAQQTERQFRSRTDLIPVDVSVVDRNGRPVHGLTASDFTLLEDGKTQPIAAFAEITLPDPEAAPVAWMRDVAPDVRHNDDVSEYRLMVLVMDDATMPAQPQMMQSAREIGRKVIERLGPRDLLAVVFTRDNRHAQGFTQDRARLLAAVNSLESGGHDPINLLPRCPHPMTIAEQSYFYAPVRTLHQLVDTLGTIPDRRKAVVLVSVGITLDPQETRRFECPVSEIFDEFKEVLRQANRAAVNVYPIDPGGLDGMRAMLQRNIVNMRYEIEIRETTERSETLSALYRDFLLTAADNTGGRAIVNTNEFQSRVDQIFRITGSFYLLGYVPAGTKADGKYHRIQVRTTRRDLTVAARNGYYAPEPVTRKTSAPPPATIAAVAGLLPKSDLPLDVVAAPFALPGQNAATVAIALGLRAPAAGRPADTVNLLLNAYSVEGDLRASDRLRVQVDLSSGATSYEVLGELTLKPGRYELRLSADSAATQKSGSVYSDLDVPDFEKAPLSLSGLVLSAAPAAPVSPRDLFAGLIPVAPTTRRAFARTDEVAGFVRLYEGRGTPVAPATLTVRITDGKGAVVSERLRSIAADEVAKLSVDHRFAVPVADLPPGAYLLTVEATAGKASARRDARFTVR